MGPSSSNAVNSCAWQAAERQALEDDLHIKLGHQLFAAAEYEQAMVNCPSYCRHVAHRHQVLCNMIHAMC